MPKQINRKLSRTREAVDAPASIPITRDGLRCMPFAVQRRLMEHVESEHEDVVWFKDSPEFRRIRDSATNPSLD
jgi:hypothetical protein